jgi:hypothetical protein
MFFIWLGIAIVQITLFSIFLFKKDTKQTIDIIPTVNYNNMTYWKEKDSLYREKTNSITMNKMNAERVDQLDSGLNPSELIYIIKLLEDNI